MERINWDRDLLFVILPCQRKKNGWSIYVATDDDTFLIYAKAKVALLKSESLARLELQAAFLGSRALQQVVRVKISSLGSSRINRLHDSSALDQSAVLSVEGISCEPS